MHASGKPYTQLAFAGSDNADRRSEGPKGAFFQEAVAQSELHSTKAGSLPRSPSRLLDGLPERQEKEAYYSAALLICRRQGPLHELLARDYWWSARALTAKSSLTR